MSIKVNSTRSAAVNQNTFWLSVDEVPPPLGVKLLLINQQYGVACLGTYNPKGGWSHWQGLPKFTEPAPRLAPLPADNLAREPIMLDEVQIDQLIAKMPGGLSGFTLKWGCMSLVGRILRELQLGAASTGQPMRVPLVEEQLVAIADSLEWGGGLIHQRKALHAFAARVARAFNQQPVARQSKTSLAWASARYIK